MSTEAPYSAAAAQHRRAQFRQPISDAKRHRSIFELPPNFFDSCRLLESPSASPLYVVEPLESLSVKTLDDVSIDDESKKDAQNTESSSNNRNNAKQRWSCNTCKAVFESLHDQRSHFKSDIHRLNVLIFFRLSFIEIMFFHKFYILSCWIEMGLYRAEWIYRTIWADLKWYGTEA